MWRGKCEHKLPVCSELAALAMEEATETAFLSLLVCLLGCFSVRPLGVKHSVLTLTLSFRAGGAASLRPLWTHTHSKCSCARAYSPHLRWVIYKKFQADLFSLLMSSLFRL